MKIDNPINILVQRRAAIGDVIMATGVVREIAQKYEGANIDVATDVFEVWRNNPHVRNVIPVDGANPKLYQIYINLDDAYELNPENNYVDSYFYRAFGNQQISMNKSVELFPTDAERSRVLEDIATWDSPYIVIHLRRWHWPAKNVSLDVWFDVFAKLFEQRTDFKVVCVGGPTDHIVDHPMFVDARSKYNAQELMVLCDHAQCFVGIDSAPYWSAAASNTHIIGLLTHLKPERIMPHRRLDTMWNATAICTQETCGGCNDRQTRPVRYIECQHGDYRCNNNFDTEAITDAIIKTL